MKSTFILQNILIEMFAKEISLTEITAPSGLQFTLGSVQNEIFDDTITMANFGYVQLKANPGIWNLEIRTGNSRIYEFKSVTDYSETPISNEQFSAQVYMGSFEGCVLNPTVITIFFC